MMNYREYTITEHGSGYTVFYMGEEIFFDTLDGAKMFIDELCEEYQVMIYYNHPAAPRSL